jgi:hypothetical protein
MDTPTLLDENWHTLLTLLPRHWKTIALNTGAISRKMRAFDSADSVLRTLLLHVARGYSLRETTVRAKAAGLASVSDVALLKRLRCSEQWLKTLCCLLLKERNLQLPDDSSESIHFRLVDGTIIREPGKTGSQWRVHYSFNVPRFCCDYFELTSTKGKGTGETLKKLPVNPNDCLIADRGFSRAADIEHVHDHGGYVIVRVNTQALPFYQDARLRRRFNLLDAVKTLKKTGETGVWTVYVKASTSKLAIMGRLCVIHKSEQAIAIALKKLRSKAKKTQRQLQVQTEEFTKHVIVFTTLAQSDYSATKVLEWYRLRWQIELVFKRFKSLAKLGHLPKTDPSSSRAWLYGKLLVCLLTEKLIQQASFISPWGYWQVSA